MRASNQTPTRTIRVDDQLWSAVQEQAKVDGVTVTSIIIDGLVKYLANAKTKELSDGQDDRYYYSE